MTRCEQCEIWKRTINPTNHDEICGCECHKAKAALTVSTNKIKAGVETSIAKDAEVKQSATIKIKPLLDLDVAKDAEVVNSKSKTAAQVFMEEEQSKIRARKKTMAKLEMLEKEVKVGQELFQQTKTLRESMEALLMLKVRVTFNQCHKFWRGSAISTHKPFVEEQVKAAKVRLGLEKHHNQFSISSMVDTIDKLAPGGCYKSANPLPSSTSTSRPGARQTSVPRRLSRFIVPPPPVAYSAPAKKSSPAPAAVPQTSSSTGGDYGIVSYGDVLDDEPPYDLSTQLELDAEEYLWDGEYDFSCQNEVEVSFGDIIWEDYGFDDAKEIEVQSDCQDAGVESYCYDAEVEDCSYYCFAEDCYNY